MRKVNNLAIYEYVANSYNIDAEVVARHLLSAFFWNRTTGMQHMRDIVRVTREAMNDSNTVSK